MEIEVNMIAIFLSAVASMIVGFLWYSPMIFGKPWMKLMGYTPESLKKAQQEMGKLYILSFLVAMITAFVLSHVMTLSEYFFHYSRMSTGIHTAIWMWLGFIMPVQFTDVIFGKKPFSLFGINTGYQLVSLLVMAIIIAIM